MRSPTGRQARQYLALAVERVAEKGPVLRIQWMVFQSFGYTLIFTTLATRKERHEHKVVAPYRDGSAHQCIFAGTVFAQPSLGHHKSFNPAVVALNGSSIATITVTNPDAAVPLTNVQFSDTMPSGIDLSPNGGTCSTLANRGSMFHQSGTETFSSHRMCWREVSPCTITVSVRGVSIGAHINTTSQVTPATPHPAPQRQQRLPWQPRRSYRRYSHFVWMDVVDPCRHIDPGAAIRLRAYSA
jgi:uncharacterized repeat protein (TIGR01451 family)